MITFVVSIVALVLGYIFYGALVEKIFGVNKDRQTPASRNKTVLILYLCRCGKFS